MGEIWKGGMSSGSHQVQWDGVALDGSPAVKGTYKAQVKAWDSMGNEVGTRTEATGIVQSVTFDEGEPVLTVNGQKVYLRDVKSFHTAEDLTHSANNTSLQGQTGSIQLNSNNAVNAKSVPVEQAMNAYSENRGIYD
jgi:hypothetical protein